MQVSCPKCSAVIPAEDVNVARVLAKCRACGAVFNFESQLALPSRPPSPPVARVVLPPGIELHSVGPGALASGGPYRGSAAAAGDLVLSRRWFSAHAIFLLAFSVVWFSFLAFWYTAAFQGNAPWIFFVFPIAHLIAGFFVAHKALTGLFNRTVVRISGGRLSVRHGPIPTFGNRDVAVSDLRQLYTVTNKPSEGANSYEVHALMSVGPTIKLVSGLTDMLQAVYIERTIEDHLGIEDDPSANQQK